MAPAELAADRQQVGQFRHARLAPDRPEIEQDPFALVGRQCGFETLQVDHADLRLRGACLRHAQEQETPQHGQHPFNSHSRPSPSPASAREAIS